VIRVVVDDLAFVSADAIVRPATSLLEPTTAALRRLEQVGGAAFWDQVRTQRELAVGSAVVTGGGDLGVELVVHAIIRSTTEAVSRDTVRRALTAVLLTVDMHKRDTELKLMLGCTEEEIRVALDFLNRGIDQATEFARMRGEDAGTGRSPELRDMEGEYIESVCVENEWLTHLVVEEQNEFRRLGIDAEARPDDDGLFVGDALQDVIAVGNADKGRAVAEGDGHGLEEGRFKDGIERVRHAEADQAAPSPECTAGCQQGRAGLARRPGQQQEMPMASLVRGLVTDQGPGPLSTGFSGKQFRGDSRPEYDLRRNADVNYP